MAKLVSQMTQDELKTLIESTVEDKLLELVGDPDEGLSIHQTLRRRLKRQKKSVEQGERGEPLDKAVKRLGLRSLQ